MPAHPSCDPSHLGGRLQGGGVPPPLLSNTTLTSQNSSTHPSPHKFIFTPPPQGNNILQTHNP